ncbi:MAG: hypothetical protein AB1Z98_23180 [Nannocystaceae bacterium]
MPSAKHQSLVRLLTERPRVLLEILESLTDLDLSGAVELRQGPEATRAFGTEDYRADGTIVVHRRPGRSPDRECLVVEVQLRIDLDKLVRWPVYVVGTGDRLRCPVTLIVFTPSEVVEQWATRPIDLGRGRMVLRPLVIGPSRIPREISREVALRLPALAVLVVVAHGRGPGSEGAGRLAIEAVHSMLARSRRDAMLYMDVITAFLDEAVLDKISEDRMRQETYEPISAFAKRHRAQGRQEGRKQGLTEGRASALLLVLETQGVEVRDDARARILECRDPALLERWLRRAVAGVGIALLFDDE